MNDREGARRLPDFCPKPWVEWRGQSLRQKRLCKKRDLGEKRRGSDRIGCILCAFRQEYVGLKYTIGSRTIVSRGERAGCKFGSRQPIEGMKTTQWMRLQSKSKEELRAALIFRVREMWSI